MIKYENHCYCCDLPCMDCGRKHVAVGYCDVCKDEAEKLYEYAGKEMCEDCMKEMITKEVITGGIEVINSFFQEALIIQEDDEYYLSDDWDEGAFSYEEIIDLLAEEDFKNCDIELFINYGVQEIEIEVE